MATASSCAPPKARSRRGTRGAILGSPCPSWTSVIRTWRPNSAVESSRGDPIPISDSWTLSHKYIGKPFPLRNAEGRIALVIEIEKARYLKLPFDTLLRPAKNGAEAHGPTGDASRILTAIVVGGRAALPV